jgi:hypothetical protein
MIDLHSTLTGGVHPHRCIRLSGLMFCDRMMEDRNKRSRSTDSTKLKSPNKTVVLISSVYVAESLASFKLQILMDCQECAALGATVFTFDMYGLTKGCRPLTLHAPSTQSFLAFWWWCPPPWA